MFTDVCIILLQQFFSPPVDPPQITQQPADQVNVNPGSTVTFTVAATTDAGSLTYQWQLNGADLTSPPAGVSGATTNNLTIANVQESNEGMYRCVVTNDAGNTDSNAAQLTVCECFCGNLIHSFKHVLIVDEKKVYVCCTIDRKISYILEHKS